MSSSLKRKFECISDDVTQTKYSSDVKKQKVMPSSELLERTVSNTAETSDVVGEQNEENKKNANNDDVNVEIESTEIHVDVNTQQKVEIKENDDDEAVDIESSTAAPIIDPYKLYNWESAKIVLRATSTFMDTNNDHYKYLDGGNFLKSIYWSPDGLNLLSNSNDRTLRIFNPLNTIYYGEKDENEMTESVIYKHSEPVYDICWYPQFKTNDYSTNVFVSCSRDSPIFMFDAWQNSKRAQYRHLFADCIVTPYSVSFDESGKCLYAGYKKYIIQFATTRPGSKHCKQIKCVNRNNLGQKSIISVIKFSHSNDNVFASGCYDGIAQLFDVRCSAAICAFKCIDIRNNGVTDISFSPCNNYLLCGSRRSNDINCWDLRKLKGEIYENGLFASVIDCDGNTRSMKDNDRKKKSLCAKYKRNICNNQRVQFDIDKYCGHWIVSGNQSGNYCNVYDVNSTDFEVEPKYKLKHPDNVQSVSSAQLCPTRPFLATTTGQRVLAKSKVINKKSNNSNTDDSEESDDSDDNSVECQNVNDIYIWDLRFA